jgi:hypothetical protein
MPAFADSPAGRMKFSREKSNGDRFRPMALTINTADYVGRHLRQSRTFELLGQHYYGRRHLKPMHPHRLLVQCFFKAKQSTRGRMRFHGAPLGFCPCGIEAPIAAHCQPLAADVVGLYVDPPAKAIVLCADEKPSIQARHGFRFRRASHSTCSMHWKRD